jgi:hypothetical protein
MFNFQKNFNKIDAEARKQLNKSIGIETTVTPAKRPRTVEEDPVIPIFTFNIECSQIIIASHSNSFVIH